uniref:Uncharacterized protein n=1 Tax=Anguilla anguilla TaxID=7936 RepID=A0A0E9P9N4_ANGAN
MQRKLITL